MPTSLHDVVLPSTLVRTRGYSPITQKRDEDPDLALLALGCRVIESILGDENRSALLYQLLKPVNRAIALGAPLHPMRPYLAAYRTSSAFVSTVIFSRIRVR